MDLKHYWSIFWRRKWIALGTLILTVAVAVAGTFLITPTYTASATLRIATTATGAVTEERYDTEYTDRLMNTYSKIAFSDPIIEKLVRHVLRAGYQLDLSAAARLTVDILPNTELLRISFEDSDPKVAALTVNELADIIIEDFKTNYLQGSQVTLETLRQQMNDEAAALEVALKDYEAVVAQSPQDQNAITRARSVVTFHENNYAGYAAKYEQVRLVEARRANTISVVEPAAVPSSPSNPRRELVIALGVLVGLVGGAGLALLFENLDTKVFSLDEIEKATKLTSIGYIPITRRQHSNGFFNGNSPEEEAFRHLRTNILNTKRDAKGFSLLVTSAEPGEGKSTVAINLARSLALSGRRVMMVDGDMRKPSLHSLLKLENEKGLSTILHGEGTWEDIFQLTTVNGLAALTSGPIPRNPTELLGSARMSELLTQLKENYEIVVIDTPPLLPVTDAAVLASNVDGVLLVVAQAAVGKQALQAASRRLSHLQAPVLGAVINRAKAEGRYDYYQYHSAPEHQAN